jgi:hypothetical protein
MEMLATSDDVELAAGGIREQRFRLRFRPLPAR